VNRVKSLSDVIGSNNKLQVRLRRETIHKVFADIKQRVKALFNIAIVDVRTLGRVQNGPVLM
jgi:hypothetical protein